MLCCTNNRRSLGFGFFPASTCHLSTDMQFFTAILGRTFFFALFTAFLGLSTAFWLRFDYLLFRDNFGLDTGFFCRLALFFDFPGLFLGFFLSFLFSATFCFLFFDLALGFILTLFLFGFKPSLFFACLFEFFLLFLHYHAALDVSTFLTHFDSDGLGTPLGGGRLEFAGGFSLQRDFLRLSSGLFLRSVFVTEETQQFHFLFITDGGIRITHRHAGLF